MKRTYLVSARSGVAVGALAAAIGSLVWAATSLNPSEPDSTATAAAEKAPDADTWAEQKRDSIRQNEGDTSFYYAMTTPSRGKVARGDTDAVARFALSQPIGALTALPATGDPVRGTFSPVIPWPLVGIHSVLTADGRVLSYGTKTNGIQTGYYVYDLWDPQLGMGLDAHTTLPNTTAVDLFCNAQQLLPSGDIEMWGGDVLRVPQDFASNLPTDDTNLFRGADDGLVRTGKMFRKRWYASAITLPNGNVFIQGGDGGKDRPEVRTSTGTFRLLSGADTNYLAAYYPRNFVAPDGKVFGIAYSQMFRIDASGTGTLTRVGKFTSTNIGGSSSAVMFRPGRILQVGGGIDDTLASRASSIIDINGASPVITALPQVTYRRHWPNVTVLADGRVFLSGGSTINNNPANGVAYTTEIFNPATNTWSLGATAQQMRLYHSTSLLLPDATVLTLGGGSLGGGNPGPQLNLNGEIYYPPYLFNANGTPAARPIISTAPMSVQPATKFRIGTPSPSAISRVTIVRSGSVTHSFDMGQRFLQLPFTVVGSEIEATLPTNTFETPPGFYLVFVINSQGVPSEAAMMRINVAGQTPPPPANATLTVRKVVVNDNGGTGTAPNFSFSVNNGTPVAFEADGSNALTVPAGTYNVTEPAASGYATTYSGCSNVVLAAGGNATCTITNNDIATSASLTVRKIVVNDNGGAKVASDFSFSVNGAAAAPFEADGSNTLTVAAGTYNVTEPASSGYAASFSGCSGIVLAAGGSATCTITNNDIASGTTNLIANGDFEVNSLAPGTAALVANVLGWTNSAGPVKLWKGRNGLVAGSGQSNMEIDAVITVPNSVYQDIATVAGATYDLSFLQSPRPGFGFKSNRFEVWWNGTLLATFARDGLVLTNADWQRASYVVTGTGNDRLSFREVDVDVGGGLVDDVRLTAR
ncbi:galactose oxidase-like domain-containing protein [Lysobacter niastensis]|uniref:DUF1929 domain-containing protein n=1 Tax=Lysobacter niastensis TaxID=380629 RepID=A0ABS0BDC0_9GAMM|nr:galactose oxidase-like domain-containing protein [Lysobacter niastensis]MBF6025004.1 DUF1929 domain-containing protein [Lysobacter niastensis]